MEYRAYFKIKFSLLSPLSIGASSSEATDKDIVLNSGGKPLIPATAIAGVFRAISGDSEDIFGEIENRYKNLKFCKTQLLFYDAKIKTEFFKTVRDSVALDEHKTAVKGAKFDFQAVEPGADFIGYVEARTQDAANKFKSLLQNKVYFGAKSTRGYGCVGVEYQEKVFGSSDVDEWLDFDMFEDSCWGKGRWIAPDKGCESKTVRLMLKQNGGLSIRQYSTEPNKPKEQSKPDSIPLALHDKTPVIPGTSWAGMFLSHMKKLLKCDDKTLGKVFGFISENSRESAKSKIRFGESQIRNCTFKQMTRNAIDRFTNGTKDGALFTEVTVFNGTTELEITLDDKVDDDIQNALIAAILDLHNGYAAVGGLTSIGRGLFNIISVNRVECEDWSFEHLKEVVFGGR